MIRFDSALAEFWDRGVPEGTLREQNREDAVKSNHTQPQ
jgi:hypothetical protein